MIKTPTKAIWTKKGWIVDVYLHSDGTWHSCTMRGYSWKENELKFLND